MDSIFGFYFTFDGLIIIVDVVLNLLELALLEGRTTASGLDARKSSLFCRLLLLLLLGLLLLDGVAKTANDAVGLHEALETLSAVELCAVSNDSMDYGDAALA